MRKQSRQLLILVLALVLLIAGWFGVKKYNEIQAQKPEEETEITVIETSREDIVSFSYDYEGVTYSFEKEDDTWYYAEDHSLTINQNSITAMLNRVAPLTAEQELGEVSDLSQYGLEEPLKTITYATADQSYTIQIGDYNSLAAIYYMKLPSESTVYTVLSPVKSVFDKTLEDLVEEETAEESTEESTEESSEESTGESEAGDAAGDANPETVGEAAVESVEQAGAETTEEATEESGE